VTLGVTFRCVRCGASHQVPLDATGHYAGPLPCSAGTEIELQVEGEAWRAFVAQQAKKTVH
jgi:hypothetical protein